MKRLLLIIAVLLYATPALAHPGWGGGWGHWGGGGWGWHHDNDFGSSFLGGVIGGAIGNMFAPPPVVVAPPPVYVQPQPVPEMSWQEYCARKYRSFDGSTYLGFDGQRHPCTY